VPPDFDQQTEDALCCRKIFATSADRCTKRETCHSQSGAVWTFQCRPTFQIWPCRLFLVPEVEILTKRSLISDGRGDRRKFNTGPSRHPTKHIPGRVSELEKTFRAVYQEWRGVLWRRQVWLSCMWNNKLKTKKVRFLYGLPSYSLAILSCSVKIKLYQHLITRLLTYSQMWDLSSGAVSLTRGCSPELLDVSE